MMVLIKTLVSLQLITQGWISEKIFWKRTLSWSKRFMKQGMGSMKISTLAGQLPSKSKWYSPDKAETEFPHLMI
ncbi:hypothetical protein PS2_019690 [Malus domestica]